MSLYLPWNYLSTTKLDRSIPCRSYGIAFLINKKHKLEGDQPSTCVFCYLYRQMNSDDLIPKAFTAVPSTIGTASSQKTDPDSPEHHAQRR